MKKFLVLFMLLLLSVQALGATRYAYYLVKVDSSSYRPSTVYAGNEVAIAVTFVNNTTVTAKDVSLELSLGEDFEAIDTVKLLGQVLPKATETVTFRIKAKEGIPAGTYNLSLKMDYTNLGEKVTDTATVSVTVSEIYKVTIDTLYVSNYYPHIGENVIISAKVRNIGSIEARNVYAGLSMVGSGDFGNFIVLSEINEDFTSMNPGEDEDIKFMLNPSGKISPGVYSFKLVANYIDCDRNAEEKFSLQVYGKPDIIISGIDYSIKGKDTKNLVQGEIFSFSVQLDNLGEEDVKKVEIEITDDRDFVGSKKSYVGSIDADDSSAGLFDLMVSENAELGDHEIHIAITYLDELGAEQRMEGSYTVHVLPMPEPNPYIPYMLVIVILIVLYFLIKMVFRQLAIRKL